MKLTALTLLFSIFLVAPSVVEWQNGMEHDFDYIPQGKAVYHEFEFKNTSEEAFVIDVVRTTCGCTVPEYAETPVAPDSIGVIRVKYDGLRKGYFKKKVKVFFSNQLRSEVLTIEGFVED